jgi:RNA polymerase sigma-70 factor (ECF subfamily)
VNRKIENSSAEKQLVNRILQGDKHGFGIIIKNTEALVAQIVSRLVDHAADRKDIAQDIYLKAYKNLQGFKFQAKLSTWIGQIAYNTCINHLERKKLVLPGGLYDKDEDNGHEGGTQVTEAEVYIGRKELSAILAAGIDKLPPVYKTLIVLYHQEELSYTDITQVTGLPEGTVKNYLFRARKMLRENILVIYKKEEL